LRHREDHSAHVGERSLHLSRLLEDAEGRDLRGEPFPILRAVVRADSQEHDDTGFDLGDALVADLDRGRANPLNDRAR
jgi:hypothetical protein